MQVIVQARRRTIEEEEEEEGRAQEGVGAVGSASRRLSPPLRLVVPLPRASDVAPSTLGSAAQTRAAAAMRRRLYAFLAPRAPRTTLGELRELCAAIEADTSATTVGGDLNGALDALARKHGVRRIDLDPWARRAMWQSLVRLFRRCDGATLLSEVDVHCRPRRDGDHKLLEVQNLGAWKKENNRFQVKTYGE